MATEIFAVDDVLFGFTRHISQPAIPQPRSVLMQCSWKARVDRAKQLLNDSAWSIAQITEVVGYADLPTFSRLFTSRVGEMLARYRRRQV